MQVFVALTGFRLARRWEVWEWVVKRRTFHPFIRISGWILYTLLISMHLHIYIYTALQGGLVSWYSWSLSSLMSGRQKLCITPPALKTRRYSQESGNRQDKTSISVSNYTPLARPALQQSGLPHTAPFVVRQSAHTTVYHWTLSQNKKSHFFLAISG